MHFEKLYFQSFILYYCHFHAVHYAVCIGKCEWNIQWKYYYGSVLFLSASRWWIS